MPQSPAPIEAIDRALSLLQTLSKAGIDGIPLTELATPLGMNKSTAYRALNTLKLRDYVVQDPITGRYSLGPAAVGLHSNFFEGANLPAMIHPLLLEMSSRAGELVHLGVPVGTDMLYVDKVIPERAIQVWSRIGQTINMAKSAMGRAVLAYRNTPLSALQIYVDSQQSGTTLAHPEDAVAPVTIEKLWDEIKLTKQRGYATEICESQPGVACLSVAIVQGITAVAAVSITAPYERMSNDRITELYQMINEVLPPRLPAGLTIPQPLGRVG